LPDRRSRGACAARPPMQPLRIVPLRKADPPRAPQGLASALLATGFRPFYLLASIFAALSIPLWALAVLGSARSALPRGARLARARDAVRLHARRHRRLPLHRRPQLDRPADARGLAARRARPAMDRRAVSRADAVRRRQRAGANVAFPLAAAVGPRGSLRPGRKPAATTSSSVCSCCSPSRRASSTRRSSASSPRRRLGVQVAPRRRPLHHRGDGGTGDSDVHQQRRAAARRRRAIPPSSAWRSVRCCCCSRSMRSA
jgi:hypothetical protein